MNKLILICVFISSCFALDVSYDTGVEILNRNSYSNKQIDFYNHNYYFNTTIEHTTDNSRLVNEIRLNRYSNGDGVNYRDKQNYVYLNSLFYEYKLNNKLIFTGGLLPFSDDNFNNNFTTKRNGLSTLIDMNFDGIFATYKSSKGIYKIGYGIYDNIKIPVYEWQSKYNKNSDGLFFIYQCGNFEFNAYSTKLKYDNVQFSELNLIGGTYKRNFDDELNIYGSFGGSKYIQNPEIVKNNIMKINNINTLLPIFYPELFNFKKSTNFGYNYLIGANKEFDSNYVRTYTIGGEYYFASKGFVNLVSPLTNSSYNEENRGNQFKLYLSIYPTKTISIELFKKWINKEYSTQIGTITNPVKTGTIPNLVNDYKGYQDIGFKINYNF